MRRETNPEARRLIAEVERIERDPWPGALDAYGAALLALGVQCEAPAGKAEVFRWLSAALAGVLNPTDPQLRELRVDALADVVSTIDGRLYAFRAALDHRCRPNLRSMLRAAVIWQAGDIATTRYRRHDRRRVYIERPHFTSPGSPYLTTLAREVVAHLSALDTPVARALLLVGSGESIAAAARLTGASRQQIYRALQAQVQTYQ